MGVEIEAEYGGSEGNFTSAVIAVEGELFFFFTVSRASWDG